MNRLLNKLKQVSAHICMCDDIKQDLLWFIHFMSNFNGKVLFPFSCHQLDVFVDASLNGIGA